MKLGKKLLPKKSFIALILSVLMIIMYLPSPVYAESAATFKTGQIYSGFQVTEDKPLTEMNSEAIVFQHVKSGARLLYIKNDDENKVFSINFYTPPSDDAGINHIIEHSVLYGSEKYPVKSPLMQVLSKSVSNFANALTYNDRTEYPFATTNYKDFKNLMGIYMDAVFFPKFRTEPKIFSQEGWHYGLDSKDSDLTYNGVVYNEMKGNYSNPSVILEDNVMKSLFPDTFYKYESGGDPQVIPTLTREKTLATYNKNYQPSNSFIYVYGKLDILDTLKSLDNDYLSKFDKKDSNKVLPMQKTFDKLQEKDAAYAIPQGSDTKNKAYMSLNYAVDIQNKEDVLGLQLLNLMLLGSNTSLLSNAIIQNGFGSSVQGTFNFNLAQPVEEIQVSGANEADKDKYVQFMNSTLKTIAQGGLDKKVIESVFSLAELSFRAQKTVGTKGLSYAENAAIGWMYTGDPTKYLEFDQSMENIKKSIDSGYFEKLIQKYFIDNKHCSLVVLKPQVGLQESMDSKAKKELADHKAKLSAKEIDSLVQNTKELKTWQDAPDTKEALATIPTLSLSDINTNSEAIPTIEKNIDGVKILDHSLYTNKVAYMNMYFDSTTVPQDKLPYLYLLSNVLGSVDTQKHSAAEINSEIMSIGGLNFSPTAISKFKDSNTYYPKLKVTCTTSQDNLPKAMNLAAELMTGSKFDNKEQLRSLIKQINAGMKSSIENSPNSIANSKASSYFSVPSQYNEVGELSFYSFIKDLDANFDTKSADIAKNLKEVASLVFNKQNLIIGVTIDGSNYGDFEKNIRTLLDGIGNSRLQTYKYNFNNTSKNDGLIIPSKVQYIAEGYDINKLGYKYSGSMEVLSKILTNEYLMGEVREKGGAYGSSFGISSDGTALFTSYRDPNLKDTLKAFSKASDFLRNFKADDNTMTSYILGIVNSKDSLMDPASKGNIADNNYISGETPEDSKQILNEILNTKAKDISGYADMVDAIMKKNTYCVVGNGTAIEQNKDLFQKVTDILK